MYLGIPPQRLGLEEDQSVTSGSGTSAGPGSSTLPYREALEETERKQREAYERDCANVHVLETLERQYLSPRERVELLERKLAAMPRIVQGHKLIKDLRTKRLTGKLSDAQFRAAIQGVLHAFPEVSRFPFPSGYAIGSAADEVARARCQLSRARWEFLVWNRTGRIPGRLTTRLGETIKPRDIDPGIKITPPKIDPGIRITPEKDWCPELRKIQSASCFAYEPSEIRISHTEAGHLTPDVVIIPSGMPAPGVVISCRYLVIRDFGVSWRHVKAAPKSDPLFNAWLARFESDKTLLFRIVGYSDCVGPEGNNLFLRKGRAQNVFRLLGPSARSRVISVQPAPADTFLTDNSTVAARANNRSVVIEFFINKPTVVNPV